MLEIMQILYAMVQERCHKNVLSLHNQTFLHAIACEEVIGKPIIVTEKNYMVITCTHLCATHLSNIASSALGQSTQNNKSAISTLLRAYPWQHQADDLERSSPLA